MESNTEKQTQIGFSLLTIEILEFSLFFEEKVLPQLKTFHYNLNLEQKIIEEKSMVIVTTSVGILHEDKETMLAKVKVNFAFNILNIEKVMVKENENLRLPKEIDTVLNSISISTVRGIMFSLFRGTLLHGAILPIVDPAALNREQ
jgi:hypothetical protein